MDDEIKVIHRHRRTIYRGPNGNPDWLDDAWTRLAMFQSRDLLSDRYRKRHNEDLDD